MTAPTNRDILQLRLQIGRSRRRIDRRLGRVEREGRRLASWRTYVERYPVYSMLGALGVGVLVAAGLRKANWTRFVGGQLVKRAVGGLLRSLKGEMAGIWSESGPKNAGQTSSGGDDAGS
jgi:hypothetical protein